MARKKSAQPAPSKAKSSTKPPNPQAAEITARDAASAASALAEAVASNRHVPAFVPGRRKLPRALPALYALGSVEEAIIYAHDWAGLWKATDGAIAFLDAHAGRA